MSKFFNGKEYADFSLNDSVSFTKKFSIKTDFQEFSKLSGDYNPLHHDTHYSQQTEFQNPIVPMHLATLPLSAIAGMIFPGRRSLYLSTSINALQPIPYDEEITYSAKIVAMQNTTQTLKIQTILFKEMQIFLQAEQIVKVRSEKINFKESKKNHPIAEIKHYKPYVFIVGATGEIGANIALAFAKQGYDLLLHYNKNITAMKDLVNLCASYGVSVDTVQADLLDSGEREKLTLYVKQKPITHFVHSASAGLRDNFEALMHTNYIALKQLNEALMPQMLRQQNGFIVFIGSSAIQHYPKYWDNYVAAKAASVAYVNSVNKNFCNYGIRVMTFAPGFVVTKFSDDVRGGQGTYLLPEQVASQLLEILNSENHSSYYWHEPAGIQNGNYGFYSDKPVVTNQMTDSVIMNLNERSENSKFKLDSLIKDFFKLTPDFELEHASLDQFQGWDSLKHIQFLLEVEKIFGITFTSQSISQTKTYAELLNAVNGLAKNIAI